MSYQQLAEVKRYQISVPLEQGFSIANIAKCIHCHRSSAYREIKRCQGQPCYNPKEAHQKTVALRRQSAKYTIPERCIETLLLLLQLDWSPEQISHELHR